MKIIIDTPQGWLYGFPKEIPNERIKDVTKWLVEEGYPKKLIESLGNAFHYRMWEMPETSMGKTKLINNENDVDE
jgi:hypothetical protein